MLKNKEFWEAWVQTNALYNNWTVLNGINYYVLFVLHTLNSYIFVKLFGVNGLWYALPTAELVALIIGCIFVVKYKNLYHY